MIVVELSERRFISVGCSGGIHGGVAWRWGMASWLATAFMTIGACVSLVAFMAPGAFAQAPNGGSGPAGNAASGPVPGPAPAGSIVVERASLQFHRPNSANAEGDGSWSKLKLSDDEQSLVGCGMELAVWNTKTGKVVRSTAIPKAMHGVTLSPDNKTIVAWPYFLDFRPANGLTPIEWWQAGESRAMGIQIPAGKSQVIADMAFTRDGKSLIAVGRDLTVQLAAKLEPLPIGRFVDPRLKTLKSERELPREAGQVFNCPATISRDGQVLAAIADHRVRILELASGRPVATVEAPLGNQQIKASLALSADGSRGAVVIQPMAETEAADVIVFDAKTGRTISKCVGHVNLIAAVAMTPDGKWLASGGWDTTARIWEAETGREVARFKGLRGATSTIAIRANGRGLYTAIYGGEVQGWMLPESDGRIAQPAPAVAQSGTGPANGKAPVLDSNLAAIAARNVESVAFSRPQEELYLLVAADRLLSQAPKLAELPANAPEVRQFVGRCQKLRDHARAQGYDAGIAARFDELPAVLAQLATESSTRSTAVKEFTERVRNAMRERREQKEQNQLSMLGGLGLFILGSLPTYTNVRDSITGNTLTVETGTLSPAVSDYGLSSFLGGLSAEMSSQSLIEATRSVTDNALRSVLTGSLERDAALLTTNRVSIEKLYAARTQGATPPRLPVPKEDQASGEANAGKAKAGDDAKEADSSKKWVGMQDIIRMRQAKKPTVNHDADARRREAAMKRHMEEVVKAQDARCQMIRGHLGKHEPFSAAALVTLKGMTQTPSDKRGEQWFEDGERIAKMASFLPTGAAFDGERAELLGIASDLILRAAQIEVGPRSWKERGSERAAAALPILEAALRFDPADEAGILREQKALACCLSGRIATGYALATTLKPIRGESQRFRFLMARAATLTGHPQEAIAELEVGIEKLGMTDILPVKNCPDLPRDDPRFRELTTVQVEGVCRSGLSGGTVAVVNRSSFPLTNVRAQLNHPTRAGRKTTEEFVAQLPPGEEIEVPYDSQFGRDLLPGKRNKEDLGTIVVVSSQGRATATVK